MLINTKKELIKEIKNLLKPNNGYLINKIDFICPNFNEKFTKIAFKPKNLGQEIYKQLLSINNIKQTHITIHSFDELIEEQIFKGKYRQYTNHKINIIRYYNKDNDIMNIFTEQIRKSAGLTKKYDSLADMLDDIKDIKQLSLQPFKETIIKHIENIINESILFNDIIKDGDKVELARIIDTLENYIKQAIQDKDNENLKNIIKTICGVVLVFITGGSASIVLLGLSASLLASLLDYQILQDKKYQYIKNPIIEFLSTELAMYIQLTNTRLLSCILIVESTMENDNNSKIEFIDLSGFNLNIDDTLLSCSQNIALKGEFIYNKENKIDILKLLQQYYISIPPMIKSSAFETKALNIYKQQNKQKERDIKKHLLLDSIIEETKRLNHLVYIESPHFNSALLAEIFNNKNTQYPNNHITKMAKNYLLITNAPSKYNAKLTETITKTITNNKIKDDINNHEKQHIIINYQNKQSSYNTKRDYSTYRIEVEKKDDEPYLLQLSAFVRVDDKKVKNALVDSKEHKQIQQELDEINKELSKGDMGYTPSSVEFNLLSERRSIKENLDFLKNSYGLDYIESFFKSPKEMQDIITNEEQIAKDYLNQLQNFHNGNKKLDKSLLSIFTLFYGLYIFKINFLSFKLESDIKDSKLSNSKYLNISCLKKTWKFDIPYSQSNHNVTIAEELQSKLLHTTLTQNINLSQDFIDYIKEFMNTYINEDAKILDKEIQKDMGVDFDKEIKLQEAQIKNYGEKYVDIIHKERTKEIFYTSMLKILGAICPFINFTHENMIDATKHCIAIFIQIITNKGFNPLYQTLLTEIGIFSLFLYPTSIRVHIGINSDVKNISKALDSNITYIDKIKAKLTELSNLKNKESLQNFFRGFAQVELRHTKAQLAHFEAKTAFILDTIDSNVKHLELKAIKEKLINTMTSTYDKRLVKKICFTYSGGKPQSYLLGEIQAREIFFQAKQFYTNKFIYSFKLNLVAVAIDIGLDIILEQYFSTHYEAYKREYDSMIHKRYTFYYDLPYAVKRNEKVKEKERHFTYYPMLINSKFISFDMKSMIYGTELCTGGLTHHIGLAYHLKQNRPYDKIMEFTIRKLLSYIIIDEKRGAKDINDIELDIDKQIPDYTWFNHKDISSNGDIIDKEPNISIDNILKYQVPKSDDPDSLYMHFKALEEDGKKSAIDSYNEVLTILNDYKDYYFTHTRKFNNKGVMLSYKDDKNKARRLLECLNTIGQNNIRALYVGTSTYSKGKKRPKLIGRLATTIIMEDGLWLG